MEEVRYYYDRKRAKLDLSASIFVLTMSILFVPILLYGARVLVEVRICIALVMCLLGIHQVWESWQRFSWKEPVLSINSEGLTDNVPLEGRGFVPWSKVRKLESLGPGGFKLILDPRLSENPVGILSTLRGQLMRRRQISIFAREVKDYCKGQEAQVQAFMNAAHDAQPPG